MQASQEGPRNLEGEQALGSGLGWGECSTAEQSRGEFGDAASLALSPGASLSVPRVPSHRSGHHQRSPHGSPAALAVLIDESMDDWAEAQATPSRHNHSAEREYTAPTPKQRFFPETGKVASSGPALTKSHLVDTTRPGDQHSYLKQQLELAHEKLGRLKADRDKWAAAASQAEGKLAGLKQQVKDVDDRQEELGNIDELHHLLNERQSELEKAEERVRGGLLREREADGKIAELESTLADLVATRTRLETHRSSLLEALKELNIEADDVRAQNAYMQGLLQFRANAPPVDKSHLDLRHQQALSDQMRTLQASIMHCQQQNRRAELDVNMLGEKLGQQFRQALHDDIVHEKAVR